MATEIFAVIMAGGAGTRFWPLSRRVRPKQLLSLSGPDRSLLASTVARIQDRVPAERTIVVTSENLLAATQREVSALPARNILAEPTGRNTAACIGWAASVVARTRPEAILSVLPADHHVGDPPAFLEAFDRGVAAARDGDLVTVGIRPSRPETGYGYIELGEEIGEGVHRARRFVEKPNRQRAEQFLAANTFLWNSGMFFFRADAILDAIRTHLPGLGAGLDRIDEAARRGEEDKTVQSEYASLPSVSIDHGVMEKAANVAVIPATFGWSDLGSWTTTWELAAKDDHDNVLPTSAVAIDSRGSYVKTAGGKLVALIGVENLVVVDTADALLVVPRERAQEVKEVVVELEKRGDERR